MMGIIRLRKVKSNKVGISRSGPSEGLQINEMTHSELGKKVTEIIEPALKYTNMVKRVKDRLWLTTYIIRVVNYLHNQLL